MSDFNIYNPSLIFDFNQVVPGGLRYLAFVMKSNPLLYFRFQEEAGPTAVDFTDFNNDGTFTEEGVIYSQTSPLTNEKNDRSVRFDGGFVTVPNSVSLNQAFTALGMDMWVRVPGLLPEDEQTIFGRGTGTGSNHFQLSIVPDGRIKFWLQDNSAENLAFSESPLVPNEWYHVMVVWDGSEMAVFLNGVMGPVVEHDPVLTTNETTMQVAAYNNASRFFGFIDEVAFYGQAPALGDLDRKVNFNRDTNNPPFIIWARANGFNPTSTVTITAGETVSFEINAEDPDDDELNYLFSISGFVPSFGPQLSPTQDITYNIPGTYFPVGFVTDGRFNRAAPFARIIVNPVLDLKAINDFQTVGYQQSRDIFVLSNDVFPAGGGGSISDFTQPSLGTVTLVGSGESARFNFVPVSTAQGVDTTFTYTITDGGTAFDTALVTVSIAEKKPIAMNTANYSIGPDVTVTIHPASNDRADPPSQVLTYISVQNPTSEGGSASIDTGLNRIVYTTPPDGYLGPDSFTYQVQDEDGLVGTGTANINVQVVAFRALNDNFTTEYETSITMNVLGNDTTPFVDPLFISDVTQPSDGTTTIVMDDTRILFEPDPGFFGITGFTYTMSDGTNFDTASVSVNVRNDPPVPGTVRVSTTLNTAREIDPLAVAFDREGEPIKLVSFSQGSEGGTISRLDNDTPSDLTDDTLWYEPDTDFVGIESFTYVIEDDVGQQRTGTAFVAVDYNFSISVTPSTIPVTENVNFSANVTALSGFDKSYSFFWDFDDGNISTSRTGLHKFSGLGVFEVRCTVTDSYDVVKSLSTFITVQANQAPVAVDDFVEVAEGQLLEFDPRDNDFDPDGDLFAIIDVQSTSDQGGFVAINNAGTPGNPYDDFISYVHPVLPTPFSDSFQYTIEDEFGLQATATVFVEVLANQPPVATAVFRPTLFNTAVDINVLDFVTDPEDDDLFVQSVSGVSNGTASIIGPGPNNFIRFTPFSSFLGVTTFNYTARDAFSNTSQSTVTVPVFGQFYPKMVHGDDPIAFWPMNEASGSRAFDMMPGQVNGNYVNSVDRTQVGPLAKDLENAARVDQGHVQFTITSLHSSFEDELSIEFWVKNTSLSSVAIIQDVLTIAAAGTSFVFNLTTTDGAKNLTIPNMELNEWYHLVITYDGDWIRAYIDGEVVASTTHEGNVILPNRLNLGLGLLGSVSMLALYTYPLPPATVLEHYEEAVGPIVNYQLSIPSGITPGSDFDVVITARDVTGKTVKTDSTTEVEISSDGTIEFDADGDGNYGT